jgi:hypothetical protein
MEQNKVEKVFCVFPVFAPSTSQKNRNVDSIKSFIGFINNNSHLLTGEKFVKLDIVFAGYAYKDEYWNEIESLIRQGVPSAEVYRFDKNYGKARLVNKMVETYTHKNPETQYLFTMDSDMKFVPGVDAFFDRLLLMSQVMQKRMNKPFGFISLNQLEENCIWYHCMDQSFPYQINPLNIQEEFVWPSQGSGIPGGGLFISLKAWKVVGGYRHLNSSYNGEDGWFSADCQQKGFAVAVAKSISLIHPVTIGDEEYVKWKGEQMKSAFKPVSKEDYDSFLGKDADFWRSQN